METRKILPLHQAWGDCGALMLSNTILSDLRSFDNCVENVPHVVSRRSISRQVTHSLTLFPFFLDLVIVCQLVTLKIITIRPRCPFKVSTI